MLFGIELGIILFGRVLGTIGLIALMTCCCGYKNKISFKRLCFIYYAGLIRGAIAFGLVLRIDPKYPNREVIITTSLALVIFTTVVFGGTVSLVQTLLL